MNYSLYRFSRYGYFQIIIILLLTTVSFLWAEIDDKVEQPDRIVVVGDVHGDYFQLMNILQLAKIINAEGEWIAGNTHLVQMGDLPDRGDSTRKVVRFLMNLEKEAKRKSGRVHVLVGNHDAMNVYGDLRYVTQQEYAEFADDQSQDRLNKLYEKEIEWIMKNIPEKEWPVFDADYRETWFKQRPPGFYEHRINWQVDGEIGKWVISRDAVLRLGNCLFVHGGIGPVYAGQSIEEINQKVRTALRDIRSPEAAILNDEDGPLWYRGLASNPEETEWPHVENLLENFDVSHIVLGHTVTQGIVLPRFDGHVIMVDVGLSNYYGGYAACLVIEDGKIHARYGKNQIALPVGEGDSGTLEYLRKVQQLFPDNTSINERIDELDTLTNAVR